MCKCRIWGQFEYKVNVWWETWVLLQFFCWIQR